MFNFISRNKIIPHDTPCETEIINNVKDNVTKKSRVSCEIYNDINLKIRNMKVLSEIELAFVETLPHEELTELINIYNSILDTINTIYLDNTTI